MKKAIYILIFLIILAATTIGGVVFNKSKELANYQDPDGNYELIIINGRSIFFSTMPGDGGRGSMLVDIILKDANGNIIGKSRGSADCGIFYDSIEVTWDLENDQVFFARARTINLKTGKVEC